NLAVSINTATFQPELFDKRTEIVVIFFALALGLNQPCIITGMVNVEDFAHQANCKTASSRFHERVLFFDSTAKNAAAFFRISRSIVRRLTSALSARISSSLALFFCH